MPTLGAEEIQKFELPTYEGTKDPAWVKLNIGITSETALEGMDEDTDPQDITRLMVTRAITDWNFTDATDEHKKMAITLENVRLLRAADYSFLIYKLGLSKIALAPKKKSS